MGEQASSRQPPRAIGNAPPGGYATAASHVPDGPAKQAPPRPRTSQIDDPSLSMPIVARRPWGLIIVVLLIDVGLAVAGGWMLREGLGGDPAPAPGGAPSGPVDPYATTKPGHDALPPGSK